MFSTQSQRVMAVVAKTYLHRGLSWTRQTDEARDNVLTQASLSIILFRIVLTESLDGPAPAFPCSVWRRGHCGQVCSALAAQS